MTNTSSTKLTKPTEHTEISIYQKLIEYHLNKMNYNKEQYVLMCVTRLRCKNSNSELHTKLRKRYYESYRANRDFVRYLINRGE